MRGRLGLIALFLLVAFAVYFPALRYPHIQDDWSWMHLLEQTSLVEFFQWLFGRTGGEFMRPFSGLYHFVMHSLFRFNPLPFHILHLVWLALGGVAATVVLQHVCQDKLIARLGALLAIAATPIWMDPVLWEAGINELMGVLFAMTAVAFFCRGRPIAGAVIWWCALHWKEAPAFIPFWLVLLVAADRPAHLFRAWVTRLWPFAIAAVAYCLERLKLDSPLAFAEHNPYHLKFTVNSIQINLLHYGEWLTAAVFPWWAESARRINFFMLGTPESHLLGVALIIGLYLLLLTRIRSRDAATRYPSGLLLTGWVFLSILPVLFFQNHAYRYYLAYAAPAALAGWLLILKWMTSRLPATAGRGVMVAWTIVALFFSARYFHTLDRRGISQPLIGGTNSLFVRGQTTLLVRDFLTARAQEIPDDALVIFQNIDIWSFNKNLGPRLWLDKPQLNVVDLGQIASDADGYYIARDAASHKWTMAPTERRPLDPDKSFFFVFNKGRLEDQTATLRLLINQAAQTGSSPAAH